VGHGRHFCDPGPFLKARSPELAPHVGTKAELKNATKCVFGAPIIPCTWGFRFRRARGASVHVGSACQFDVRASRVIILTNQLRFIFIGELPKQEAVMAYQTRPECGKQKYHAERKEKKTAHKGVGNAGVRHPGAFVLQPDQVAN